MLVRHMGASQRADVLQCSAGLGAANPEIVPKLLRSSALIRWLGLKRRAGAIESSHSLTSNKKRCKAPDPPAQTPDDSAAAAA